MPDKYKNFSLSLIIRKIMEKPARHALEWAVRNPYQAMAKTLADAILILLAASWAWLVSFGQVAHPGPLWPFLVVVLCARLVIHLLLRLPLSSWLHVSRFEVLLLTFSALLGVPLIAGLLWLLPDPFTLVPLPRPSIILSTEPAFYLLLMFAARITVRAVAATRDQQNLRRILVIGTGPAALSLAFQIHESRSGYHIVGFLDENAQKTRGRRWLRGLPVLGGRDDLKQVVKTQAVQEIVIAIPTLSPAELRQVLKACEATGLPVRILPPLHEIIGGKPSLRALRDVQMEDLLPRPEVQLDRAALTTYLKDRCVLVTGGGGSIGGELCRQALAAGASRLLVLGRGENSVFEITQELSDLLKDMRVASNGDAAVSTPPVDCEIIPIICDVRDRSALRNVFQKYRPDTVFHAAAHKHVPLMERYPCEAVKNNVLGTLNTVQLAVESGVTRFVLVSTDKAVNPCNVMGASKRICEMIVKGHAAAFGANMVSVRFGNVLGSRGSVVPTMTRQIRRGRPVTVTDPDMVRYFMTIPEAVQLILQAGAVGGQGEVFILEMGHPVRILDLAHNLVRLSGLVPDQDIPIHIIGSRPGEKLQEELLTPQEHLGAQKKGPFYVAPPQGVQLSPLLEQINRLVQLGEHGEETQVLCLLQEILADFHPEEAVSSRDVLSSNGIETNGIGANGGSPPVLHTDVSAASPPFIS